MNIPILSAGIACIIAAIVGGGMKALGTELPTIESIWRQVALGVFGAVLIGFAFVVGQKTVPSNSKPEVSSSNSDAAAFPSHSDPASSQTGRQSSTAGLDSSTASSVPGGSSARPPSTSFVKAETPLSQVMPKSEVHLSSGPAKMPVQSRTSATTWIDPEGGMMWPTTVDHEARTLAEADLYCKESTVGNYTNWRLPTEQDMSDLISRRYKAPAIQIKFKNYLVWTQKHSMFEGDPSYVDRYNIHDAKSVRTGSDTEAGRPESYVLCTRDPARR